MKSGVKTVVDTADIIDKDKDIYINLYYKYNARIRETNYWSERIVIINQLREDLDYLKMTLESQDKLFKELM